MWKSPIEKGNFYTQLKDDIAIKNAKASSPTKLFFDKEHRTLKFSLSDYGKTPDPNFVITYSENIKDFNFEEITKKSDSYFKEINRFSKINFDAFTFKEKEIPNAYKVDGLGNATVGFVFNLAIYGVPVLLGVLGLIIIRFFYKKIKNKN